MDAFQKYYKSLNSQQRKAAGTTDGAVLVLAGPGTGKTQLLSIRTANIIRQNKAKAENILILTFTNAAARAMRQRLASVIGHDGYNVEVETFHSFANSIVLESEGAIKYVKDRIEMSEVEKVRAIEYILDNVKGAEVLRPFGSPYIHRKEIEKRISELKNEGITPEDFNSSLKDLKADGINLEERHITRLNALSIIYENYEKLKDEKSLVLFDERGRIDYDDMILIALDALKKDEELRKLFRKEYKYVMVDEYQDTNGAQLELLFAILDPVSCNVCCVGDDDQAIYRFQGATLANFRELKKRLPALETIKLTDNYRSTGRLIELTDKIIRQLPEKERIAVKNLTSCAHYNNDGIRFLEFLTEEEELAFLVEEVKKQADIIKKDKSLSAEEREKPFNNIAVLVRKREQILRVIDAFLKAGVPYATDGEEDIRQERRVRQMLDVLELARASAATNERKSLVLYKVLTSDYIDASQTDILKFISFIEGLRRSRKANGIDDYRSCNFFEIFVERFARFEKNADGGNLMPSGSESSALGIARELKLENPCALHKAAWAINRLLADSGSRPVHDVLMRYISDVNLYRFILKRYEKDQVIRIRDLRALVSFINMVKEADMANPALGLDEFMEELSLREMHGMPVKGELATLSQDGVRLYTAHKSKGLEFYTVFMPFCLEQKSWPVRKKAETVPLPPEICRSKERATEKETLKLLNRYDELRLFYVASTRAKAYLIYTATPREKVVISQFLSYIGMEPVSGAPPEEEEFLGEYLQRTKDRDPLENISDAVQDIVTNLSLNPTSLNNYITCRRKFLYDNVLRLPGRKNQHLVFGNCAHKALEEVYTSFMDNGKFPSFVFFKDAFKKELEYQGSTSEIKTWCLDRLETLSKWYAVSAKSPVMPMDLENKLEIHIPEGPLFKGTFDKIEADAAGGIRVIDYKTGKPDKHIKAIANCKDLSKYACDDYYRQLVAYKMLYEASRSVREQKSVTKGVIQFLEPVSETVKKYGMEKGTYSDITVDLTDEMVKELKNVIMDCWNNIQALKFEKLPERDDKDRCARCEYDSICWQR